ncbi:unnamed protein product, partial [Chrysoparadoxa australica]
QIFAHDKQIKFLQSRAKRKSSLGGRGSGKTHTLGYAIGISYRQMPREKVVIGGLTYVQLDLIVMPVLREALEWMNIVEYSKKNPFGHYVVGIKPPDHWPKPKKAVGKLGYQYCITFINGFTVQFVSQDRPESHRGLNVVGLHTDEEATMDEDFITKVLKKGVRGSDEVRAARSIFYKSHCSYSSASWTPQGMHIYKVEQKYLEQLEYRKKNVESFKSVDSAKQWLHDNPPDVLYLESTCLDNPVTGQAYWDQQKLDSDPVEFAIEVANERLITIPDGFYSSFNADHHSYWKSYGYDVDDKTGLTLYKSNDYREDVKLEMSLDFNADICWAVIGQEIGREARVVNSHYAKPELNQKNNLPTRLAIWFDETYGNNEKKVVELFGDPGGNQRSASTSLDNRPFFDQIEQYLKSKDWTVLRSELKSYPRHKDKWALLDLILSEKSSRTPLFRINKNTNKVLIMVLQTTPIDGVTFNKVKSSERTAKNREYATDGGDALDYWIWKKYSHLLPNRRGFRHAD